MAKKTWMVEQRWQIPGGPVVPIRSVLEAASKSAAGLGAAEAVRKAVAVLMGGTAQGKAVGEPAVLYPIPGRILPD